MPLDPHAKRFLDRLAAVSPHLSKPLSVEERRSGLHQLLRLAAARAGPCRVEELTMPGPGGPLKLRVYSPPAVGAADSTDSSNATDLLPAPRDSSLPPAALPGLIYFHGGGFVAGSLDSHDAICRSLTRASGCRVISVDYRLAPEHPFPAAVEDACAATRWIAAHASQLEIDAGRLGVSGDSAGATLAAVACQAAVACGSPRLALQLLICPIMDYGARTESRRAFEAGYFLDEATLRHDLAHYLGPHASVADPRVSPLRTTDLQGLPPTCIHTAEFDPLRDEGREYARRLERAGVKTTYRCHSGMIHLFYGMEPMIPYAAAAFEMIGTGVRELLMGSEPQSGRPG